MEKLSPEALQIVEKVSGHSASVDEGLRLIASPVSTGSAALFEVLKALDAAGIHALDVGLKRPSLDDVFLSLTGHVAEVKVAEDQGEVAGTKRKKEKSR
jgi:ABC-2 type transport system ATP-binding protein